MGLFRTAASRTTTNNSLSLGMGMSTPATNDSNMLALLKAKITQLEEKVEQKDSIIGNLQKGLQGNMHCFNKLEFSSHTFETMSFSESQDSESTGTRSHDDHPLVTKITSELEDKNAQVATLQLQLEEQRLLATHMQERLHMSEQGKAALVSHVADLEKKIFDQANQIECLQDLNETNSSIVTELELLNGHSARGSSARRASSGSVGHGAPGNQWKMYQKLESLMATNNKISQQLSNTNIEKQAALKKVCKLEKDQLNLCDQIDALTKQLQDRDHKLAQMQMETDCDFSSSSIGEDAHHSVLPQIQQVLDIVASSSGDTNSDENNSKSDDPKLLQLSLQVCQSQLKQIQKDHEMQLQKTVRQSVQLAESRAKVDTLTAKVEHYEALMDQVLAKATPVASHTSKAARMVMANSDDNADSCKVPVGITSARGYKAPYQNNSFKRSLVTFPRFLGRGGGGAAKAPANVNLAPASIAEDRSVSSSSDSRVETDC